MEVKFRIALLFWVQTVAQILVLIIGFQLPEEKPEIRLRRKHAVSMILRIVAKFFIIWVFG